MYLGMIYPGLTTFHIALIDVNSLDLKLLLIQFSGKFLYLVNGLVVRKEHTWSTLREDSFRTLQSTLYNSKGEWIN